MGTNMSRNSAPSGSNRGVNGIVVNLWSPSNLPWADDYYPWQDESSVNDIDGDNKLRNSAPSGTNKSRN